MDLFKQLTEEEIVEFKQSARDNYIPFTQISTVWHPVYCHECTLINLEQFNSGNGKQL